MSMRAASVIAAALAIAACRSESTGTAAPPPVATAGAEGAPIAAARTGPAAPAPAPAPPDAAPRCTLSDVPARLPAPARLVAIGDLHGDAAAARAALRLAGAIDGHDRWRGGKLVVVQTGDLLDRGDDDRVLLDLFTRLEGEARAAGGAVVVLDGNHELMNAAGDFRYVTRGGFAAFDGIAGLDLDRPEVARLPAFARARAAALFPGGPYARWLARHDVIAELGDTVFVHGGLTAAWAARIDEANRTTRCWLDGEGPRPAVLGDVDGPVWLRRDAGADVDCDEVARALAAAGASRMVVAHTTQPAGLSSACDGRVWRIDVGLSAFYGGPLEVLEIDHGDGGDRVRVLHGKRP